MPKTCTIIYNPNADKGNIKTKIPKLKKIAKEHGYLVRVARSEYAGASVDLARNHPADLMISVGGDGTFREVIKGAINHDTTFLHLASGTMNDQRRQQGLPTNICNTLSQILEKPKTIKMDIIAVNDEVCWYVAVFGLFAYASHQTPREQKRLLGPISYVYQAIKEFFRPLTSYPIDYKIDDAEGRARVMLGTISSAKGFAGISNIHPNAKINDGILEVLLIKKCNRFQFLKTAAMLYMNRESMENVPGVIYHEGSDIKITFRSKKFKRKWTLDGDAVKINSNEVVIKPLKQIKVMTIR